MEEYDNVEDLLPVTPPPKKESKLSPLEQKVISWCAIALMVAVTGFVVGVALFLLIKVGMWILGA